MVPTAWSVPGTLVPQMSSKHTGPSNCLGPSNTSATSNTPSHTADLKIILDLFQSMSQEHVSMHHYLIEITDRIRATKDGFETLGQVLQTVWPPASETMSLRFPFSSLSWKEADNDNPPLSSADPTHPTPGTPPHATITPISSPTPHASAGMVSKSGDLHGKASSSAQFLSLGTTLSGAPNMTTPSSGPLPSSLNDQLLTKSADVQVETIERRLVADRGVG
jgi:hypothetical protein